jgi:glycosyltransferase involved in cell wall biosynthesis
MNGEPKLGIITGSVASRNDDGKVVLNFAIGRLLEAIQKDFPSAKVCLPILPKPRGAMNHVLQFSEENIVALPPLGTTLSSQKYFFQTRKVIRQFADENDLLLVRLPFQIPSALLNLNKPKVLQVASNPYAIVKVSSDFRGAIKLAARGFAKHLERTMQKLVREKNTRTVTNGQELWDLLNCKQGRVVVSSSLFESEMKPRTNFDLQSPPRLLFVGYLRPEKGVNTLLEAFTKVREKRALKLTLVGGSDRPTGTESLIRESIERNRFRSDIEILGSIDFGEELFNLYRSHDIYLLSSLSEGTPRTLVEARCFGCPVIATNVGGVPTSVKNNVDGLLVPANDSEAMATAIEKILNDDKLRRGLIDEGLRRAREFTLENFAANIVEELRTVAEEASV